MSSSSDELLKNEYFTRMNRVIDYILNNYAEDLNLTKLASIACFSKFHFHRLFRAMVGETLNDFIRRIRLEKAGNNLRTDLHKSITEIALEYGFSSSQDFAKAFKKHYGITPSFCRTVLNWENWKKTVKYIGNSETQEFKPGSTAACFYNKYCIQQNLSIKKIMNNKKEMQVKIVEILPFRVAYVRSIGSFKKERFLSAYKKLLQWADPKGFREAGMMVLGAMWNDSDAPEDKLIYDACITVPESIKADNWVNIQILPGGKYAVYHCETERGNNAETWMSFKLNWLIYSDYQPDDRPTYQFHCNSSEKHLLEHEILDLYMPIKPLYE